MRKHHFAWLLAAGSTTLALVACGGNEPNYGTPATVDPGFIPGAGIAPPRFAYVANFTSNNVSGYTVNPTDGKLTNMGLSWATGNGPVSIATDPLVKFAYVANSDDDNISVFSIADPSGVLTAVAGAPIAAGDRPMSVAVDPQGRYVYVANAGDNTVSAYVRDTSSGLMNGVTGSPFSAGGTEPTSVTVDPSGKFVYVANFVSNTIAIFSIDSASSASHTPGALTSVGVIATDAAPTSITIGVVEGASTKSYVAYVANFGNDRVTAYGVNTTTGALTLLGAVAASPNTSPTSVAAEPNGKFVYVSHLQQSTVSTYKVTQTGSSTGALTLQAAAGATLPATTYPYSVAADPSGKFIYTVHSSDGKVSAYQIASGTGALTAITGSPFDAEAGTSGAKFILITK
ncbi:MAG: hypothetical protein EOP36_03195 [Rubrivivax sp.]|nr:MAG: hypothetical protein EOP36_03195 [Rubrivivax sp.]